MPDSSTKILLVEDDRAIADFVATELRLEGYAVQVEHDGMRGLVAARGQSPDLILLDRMLPGLDGAALCRRLRQTSDVPILMLSARGDVPERVEGLNAGANDYLPKPFAIEELLARIQAQLRVRRPRANARFQVADLQLDIEAHECLRGERSIELTPKEFDLLVYLAQHVRQVMSRHQIMEAVWGYAYDGSDNIVDVFIRQLRQKLEPEPEPKLIHTVRGVGYVLKP